MAKNNGEETLKERRKRAKQAVEDPAKQYVTLRESFGRSYGVQETQMIAAKRDFFNVYDREISEFVDAYHDEYGTLQQNYRWWDVFELSDKYKVLVEDYLKIFRGQKRFGIGDKTEEEEREKNVRNDSARENADKLSIYNGSLANSLKAGNMQFGASEEADKMDEKVSDGAKQGVREITKWLYRNCSRRGMAIGDDHSRFVRYFVLTQPLRVKLLGFYLVEKKKGKQADMMDIMASQVGYEPNLDEFKSSMQASKFKFWKRFDGSYIYWDKLSEGMRKAKSYQGALNNYASLGEVDPPSDSDQEQIPEDEKQTEQGTTAAPKTNLDKLAKAAQVRKLAFDVFISAAVKHRTLLESKEGKNEKLVNASARNVEEHLKILSEADEEILKNGGASYKNKTGEFSAEQAGKRTDDDSIEKTEDQKLELAEEIVGYSATGIGASGSAVSSVPSYGSYIHWNIGEASHVKMVKADGWLNSIAGLTSFINGCLAIAALTKNASKETTGEIVQKCFEITAHMATIAESATASAYKIKNAKDLVAIAGGAKTTDAVKHATKASAYAGIVAGAVNMSVGIAQLSKSLGQRKDFQSGKEGLDAYENDEANKGVANRLARIIERNHENQEISGTANAVGGALQLVGGILDATGVGATVGTILNGIGAAITVTTSIIMFFKKRSDRKSTIDEYIGLEKPPEGTGMQKSLLEVVLDGCKEVLESTNLTEAQKQEYWKLVIASLDAIKDGIRAEVTAMMGFANTEQFFQAILEEYAIFLYEHAFYKDGIIAQENMLLDSDIVGDSCKKEKAYAQILKSLGLAVKYPTDSDEAPNVTVEDIFTKLCG